MVAGLHAASLVIKIRPDLVLVNGPGESAAAGAAPRCTDIYRRFGVLFFGAHASFCNQLENHTMRFNRFLRDVQPTTPQRPSVTPPPSPLPLFHGMARHHMTRHDRDVHPGVRRGVRLAIPRARIALLPHGVLRELLPRQVPEPHRADHVPARRSIRGPLAGASASLPPRRVRGAARVT